ncbi:MAG TPA: hypothetical protein VK737_05045 [Opitutales bacterium]|jgi:hypothetical protein|nr:hypothetical protein [Opitutales bacterium]
MDIPPILNPPPGTYAPPPDSPVPRKPKRHGCLTTWLILMILLELISLLTSGATAGGKSSALGMLGNIKPPPAWYDHVLLILSGLDIFCAVFVFMWKKWAFYGTVLVALTVLVLGLVAGQSIVDGLSALLLPGVLYGVLQIGGENSGWHRLK